MITEKRTLEIQGENVEEAVAAGLAELGLERADVRIEILDEGSSGFLGLGGRDASVRLTVVREEKTEGAAPDVSESLVTDAQSEADSEAAKELRLKSEAEERPGADQPSEQEIAKEIVDHLLEKMQLEATSGLRQTEPDDLTGEQRWIVDIHGGDLGLLIGQRGETLNALQFVARLMTGHAIQRRPTFLVDVENYRERREQALARLAERMAIKAVKRGRPLSLEPMPPNERRIIHMTLRDHEHVYTESTGEGSRRKVRILLK